MICGLFYANYNDNFENDRNDNLSPRNCYKKYLGSYDSSATWRKDIFRAGLVTNVEKPEIIAKKYIMKTYKNLYIQLCNKSAISRILFQHVAGKRYQHAFKQNADKWINKVYNDITQCSYNKAPIKNKIIHERKKDRTITLSPFYPNKAYDYLLAESIKPIVERSIYRWTVGNIKGRGTEECVNYAWHQVRSYKYCYQFDIKKFYDNVDLAILYNKIQHKITDAQFLTFYRFVIGDAGKGLPLGLYSSQLLSNFYLQDFDYFIKQTLKASAYIRYVDNFWIFGNNKRQLHFFCRKISEYLVSQLHLSLKENYQLYNLAAGDEIEVVGYKISKSYLRLNKNTLYKFIRLARRSEQKHSHKRARSLMSLYGWILKTSNSCNYLNKNKINISNIKKQL